MTYEQMKLYRSRWAKVKKVLVEMAGMSDSEAEEERHAITKEALGEAKSSKDFSEREFDKVLDAFDEYLVLMEGPSGEAKRTVAQPIARLVWIIEQIGLPDAYVASISQDKFGVSDWRSLSEKRLRFLSWTCLARAKKKSKS